MNFSTRFHPHLLPLLKSNCQLALCLLTGEEMKKLLYISALISVALACGTMPALPNTVFPSLSAAPVPSGEVETVEMVVTGDLHIRVEPGNLQTCADPCYLHPGDAVTCYEYLTIGDSVWCRHERGWSNIRWLKAVNGIIKE